MKEGWGWWASTIIMYDDVLMVFLLRKKKILWLQSKRPAHFLKKIFWWIVNRGKKGIDWMEDPTKSLKYKVKEKDWYRNRETWWRTTTHQKHSFVASSSFAHLKMSRLWHLVVSSSTPDFSLSSCDSLPQSESFRYPSHTRVVWIRGKKCHRVFYFFFYHHIFFLWLGANLNSSTFAFIRLARLRDQESGMMINDKEKFTHWRYLWRFTRRFDTFDIWKCLFEDDKFSNKQI